MNIHGYGLALILHPNLTLLASGGGGGRKRDRACTGKSPTEIYLCFFLLFLCETCAIFFLVSGVVLVC